MTIDLDELERLEKEATPGPWEYLWIDNYGDDLKIARSDDSVLITNQDNALIAALRNALPELIRLAKIGREAEKKSES